MPATSNITVFHGTTRTDAETIRLGGTDVTLGGGELGRGFYTGEFLHEARAWSFHKHGPKDARVVEIEISDADFFASDPLCLTASEAMSHRNNIRYRGATRTFTFSRNVIWSEIVGTDRIKCDQYKWESASAEKLLNGPAVTRKVRK